jgi:hypothetical protein
MLPFFVSAHDEYLSRYNLKGKPRSGQRSHVIYSGSPLPCHAERLAFILSYIKLNPIQEQHADTFSMTQKQCNEFVHGLNTVLQKALELADVVPASTDQTLQASLSAAAFSEQTLSVHVMYDSTESEVSPVESAPAGIGQDLPETLSTEDLNGQKLLLHDCTEREIPRPVDDDLQKDRYSGKKKKHTVKNAVIITACCLIVYVSRTFSGKVHDKKIADLAYTIPAGYTLLQDTGYQGYRPEGVKIIQPKKKPKGKELTEEEKSVNRKISSVRVRVEHAIGGVKRYRIVKDECRLRKNNFVDNVFLYCAALHNFRLKTRPFSYKNK